MQGSAARRVSPSAVHSSTGSAPSCSRRLPLPVRGHPSICFVFLFMCGGWVPAGGGSLGGVGVRAAGCNPPTHSLPTYTRSQNRSHKFLNMEHGVLPPGGAGAAEAGDRGVGARGALGGARHVADHGRGVGYTTLHYIYNCFYFYFLFSSMAVCLSGRCGEGGGVGAREVRSGALGHQAPRLAALSHYFIFSFDAYFYVMSS